MLGWGAGCVGGGVDDGRWLCHVGENHRWTAYQVHSLLWVGCTLYMVGWWPLVLFDAGDWCQWESLPAAWPTTQQATLFARYFEHGYFELTKMEAVKDNHLSDIMQKMWTLCLTQMRLVSKLFKPDPMDFTHKSDASSIWWVLKLLLCGCRHQAARSARTHSIRRHHFSVPYSTPGKKQTSTDVEGADPVHQSATSCRELLKIGGLIFGKRQNQCWVVLWIFKEPPVLVL